jgi:EpsI family protein
MAQPRARLPLGTAVLLLLVAGVGLSFISGRREIVPERTRFVEFPSQLGFWHGHTSTLDADVEHVLAVDDYILSDYTGPDSKVVNLYVAYYPSQRKGESPHSPIVCIPGGGWQIGQFQRTQTGPQDPLQFPFNRVVIARDGHQQVVYYWFDERGRKIANEWWSKWYLLTDAIFKDRTDGALVRLTTPVFPGESARDADARLHAFMRLVVPTLSAYLPADQAATTKAALYQR